MTRLAAAAILVTAMSNAQTYSARKTTVNSIEVVRLTDSVHQIEVSIAPSIGNLAYEMKVNGKNLFWLPCDTLAELAAKPRHAGNPFLAPWANRLDQDAFWANGKKYLLNAGLGNLGRDGNGKPIHGLVTFTPGCLASGGIGSRRPARGGHQPAGILEASRVDGAIPVRAHDRDDLPFAGRRSGSGHAHREPLDGADARGGGLPPVFPAPRCTARPVDSAPGGAGTPGSFQGVDPDRRARTGEFPRSDAAGRRQARRRVPPLWSATRPGAPSFGCRASARGSR